MEDILQWVRERLQEDKRLEKFLIKNLQRRPAGSINVSMNHKNSRYYWMNEGQRIYLGKGQADLKKSLVEKDYYQRLLQKAQQEIAVLNHFLKHFDPDGLAEVYVKLHEERRRLIDPLILPDDLYIEKWLEDGLRRRAARSNSFPKPEGFSTSGGDIVRSKSEVIMIEAVIRLGIPYIYECPLDLKDGVIYPDLTLLSVRHRKTFYHEHYGRMDDPEYAESAVQKTRRYERSGIFLSDQLLITMETLRSPFNIEEFRDLLSRIIL